jgi:hypothetical protein
MVEWLRPSLLTLFTHLPSTTSLGTGELLDKAFRVRSIVGKSQRVAPNSSLLYSTAIRSGAFSY